MLDLVKLLMSTFTMSVICKIGGRKTDSMFISILGFSSGAIYLYSMVRGALMALAQTDAVDGFVRLFETYVGH